MGSPVPAPVPFFAPRRVRDLIGADAPTSRHPALPSSRRRLRFAGAVIAPNPDRGTPRAHVVRLSLPDGIQGEGMGPTFQDAAEDALVDAMNARANRRAEEV